MNDKVKVLSLITGLQTGGAEMMLFQTVTHLNRERYESVVVSLESNGKLTGRLREQGIKVYELGFKKKNPLHWLRLFRVLALLLKEKPQIVHAYMFHADIIARVMGKLAGIPVIISSIRNENIGGRMRERMLGMTKRFADCVTAVCRSAGERQVRQGAVGADQLTVIYNGVDMSRFETHAHEDPAAIRRELGVPEHHFVYMTVGRMAQQKNHLQLIDSFAEVQKRHPDTTLLIIGDGPLRGEIMAKIKEKGLEGHVRCPGLRTDVPRLLRGADAFVLGSLWEGFPNVVIEAMASELPVVATRTGGVAEVVEEPGSGFIVEPGVTDEMTKALSALIAMDKPAREKMGRYAKNIVTTRFTLERTLEQTDELYRSLLQRKGVVPLYERTPAG
ncbi:glycosyltransferase [Paenibacillus tarimensis]|uniref:glycosyltransferase n=1 Tax=Paenibacillus tarimensis TaxID=416012 RepID=UPI001F2A1B2D|nr:glycosyltransferase [Paenibacillus tarimensis]MCF2944971.1 glycosyltransferase [Paenibacillus tarimensis]